MNDKLKAINKAIFFAELQIKDNIDSDIFCLEGYSSSKIRIFLNNLMSNENCKYLEIGTFKGSTFCSALNNNNPKYSCVIDNFSQFWTDENSPKYTFINNAQKYIKSEYDFYDIDCFSIDLNNIREKINVYFYDGDHNENDHYKSLVYFLQALEDEFVYICDDWNWLDVKIGTYRAIRDFNLEIVKSWEFKTDFNGDADEWWNGFYIAILKKKNNEN
jgi:hypothetical protein